jgi:uncharacterized SAM-binding protein YcdF (DUF218 family)
VARPAKWIGVAVAAALVAFAAGFVVFARAVADYVPGLPPQRADAIVVLTGGELRLSAAARLLAEGRGARLLISGVNPHTSRADLKRLSGLSERLFAGKVDVDYAAHSTTGNAEETRAWAVARGYRRLIIVTSSYHMPRSLTELRRAMPGMVLVPHPVVPDRLRPRRWWTDAFTARVLLAEYVKFLPSAARYGLTRLLGWSGGQAAAGRRAAQGEMPCWS